MRVLVFGRSGQVARALQDLHGRDGVSITALGRPELDILDPGSIASAIDTARPDIAVNATAYTAVDVAETDADTAFAVNATAPALIAAETARRGIPFIHLSTDYVFSGDGETPWQEDDAPDPLSVYGRSKLAGEAEVAAANPRHAILRLSWVYASAGRNFMLTMLKLAATRDEVRVVADQFGAPTAASESAPAILRVAKNLVDAPDDADFRGVFHLAAAGSTSWAGFAEAIFSESAKAGGPSARVEPISTAEYPTPARRPANSRLNCRRIAEVHGIRLADWRDAVGPTVRRALAKGAR